MTPLIFNSTDFASLVLYEDNHLLAVRKPAGLLVQGDSSGRANLLDLAKDYIKAKYNKPGRVFMGLVHRLDRQVAGAVVLARTSKAAGRLSTQFREHQTKKIYWAVVQGCLEPRAGTSLVYLARHGHKSVLALPDNPQAQPAGLTYRTMETGPETSLVEVDLLTGRRHQIRVQLSSLGHPIVGDRQYGSPAEPENDSLGLLARRLTVRHPTTGKKLTFEAPPPADWPWLPLR